MLYRHVRPGPITRPALRIRELREDLGDEFLIPAESVIAQGDTDPGNNHLFRAALPKAAWWPRRPVDLDVGHLDCAGGRVLKEFVPYWPRVVVHAIPRCSESFASRDSRPVSDPTPLPPGA